MKDKVGSAPICIRCIFTLARGVVIDSRLDEYPEESCAFCRRPTNLGIYLEVHFRE